jgi:nicotinate-nucleotide adenylyltransferase
MRIGVFGGSFDPVHLAHLILAEQGREQGRLDQVWFVPAARPPHKHSELTPFDRRVEMLQLAVAGNPAFRVEEVEKDRAGPSYTADTLDELATKHPGHEWALLVGSDTLRDLPGWHEPRRIVARAEVLVMARPGAAVVPLAELREKLGAEVRVTVAAMPLVDISSTEVRERLRTGRSVRYLVPRAVEMYAGEKGLYRD